MKPANPHALHIVSAGETPESPASQVRRLQAEARRAAADGLHFYVAAIIAMQLQAGEIAEGGDAYPPGVRDRARRFAQACDAEVAGVRAILERQS
jgi:hypothetical protein